MDLLSPEEIENRTEVQDKMLSDVLTEMSKPDSDIDEILMKLDTIKAEIQFLNDQLKLRNKMYPGSSDDLPATFLLLGTARMYSFIRVLADGLKFTRGNDDKHNQTLGKRTGETWS